MRFLIGHGQCYHRIKRLCTAAVAAAATAATSLIGTATYAAGPGNGTNYTPNTGTDTTEEFNFTKGTLTPEAGTGKVSIDGSGTFSSAIINGTSTTALTLTKQGNTSATNSGSWLSWTNNLAGNGGSAANLTNQYTIFMDINLTNNGAYNSLLQTSPQAPEVTTTGNSTDVAVYGATSGGIGISSDYTVDAAAGATAPLMSYGVWHRVGIVIDDTTPTGSATNTVFRLYVDGALQNVVESPMADINPSQGGGLNQNAAWGTDGRWSLLQQAYFFADNKGWNSTVSVGSILATNTALTSSQIAAYGGPTANGITPIGAAAPEPRAIALLGLGIAPLLTAAVRRRHA